MHRLNFENQIEDFLGRQIKKFFFILCIFLLYSIVYRFFSSFFYKQFRCQE